MTDNARRNSVQLHITELGHAVRTAYCGYLFTALGATVTKTVMCDSYPWPSKQRSSFSPELRAETFFLDHGKTVEEVNGSARPVLLAGADVVVAGSPADLHAYLGMSSLAIRKQHPQTIVAIASMFGQGGGYRALAGGDSQALALSGLMSMVGDRDREPLSLGGPQAEHSAALALFTAITVALYQRERTGIGTEVTTSAVRSAAYLDWKSLAYYADERKVLQRGSDNGPFVLACSDGFVGFYYRDEEWPAVKRLVGDARLDDRRFDTQLDRDRNRTELMEIMQAFSQHLTRDELYHRSQELHIPAGPVLALDELHDDAQLRSRQFLRIEDVDGLGSVTIPRPPWSTVADACNAMP